MTTIRDVAKLAEVSVATVSRVFNKNGYVHAETEKRVQKAIEQLNYAPNTVARGLASKKTATIALILPDISNPFFAELARAVEDAAQLQGYTVILCNSDDRGSKEKSYIEVLKSKYIDGIIFASHTLDQADVEQMRKNDIPLVVLDRAPSKGSCTVVRSQNKLGAAMAVNHLFQVGCQKIGHLYGPQKLLTAKERMIGYEDAVKGCAWFSPSLLVAGDFTIEGGMQAARQLLERHPDVDGIFAGNDLMAVGALKTLQRMGIKVPEQVAVCGFDGIGLTEIMEPELTTIAQPIYEMGAVATRRLLEKIDGAPDDNRVYEMDVLLVPRQSTRREL